MRKAGGLLGAVWIAVLLLSGATAPSSASAYVAYVGCDLAAQAKRTHVCVVGEAPGAFFEAPGAEEVTTYEVCVVFPGDRKRCRRDQMAESDTLYVNHIRTTTVGKHRVSWFVDGVEVATWTLHMRRAPGHPRHRKPVTIPTTARKAIFRAVCQLSERCGARVEIKAGKKTLARGRYSVPAHSSRKVRIGLTKAGRRALARMGRVRAKLKIVDTRTHKREAVAVVLKRR